MTLSWLIPAIFRTPNQHDYPKATIPLYQRHDDGADSAAWSDEESAPGRSMSGSSIGSVRALKTLNDEVDVKIADSGKVSSVLGRQTAALELAIDDVGMGRYQRHLFIMCGCGWGADNLWLNGLALCLPSMATSFGVDSTEVKFATLALTAGLCLGALCWGALSDMQGRKWAFNGTLLMVAVFGGFAGRAESLVTACLLFGFLGFGLGGNLVVDGTLLLEFLPARKKSLLTWLSISWAIGAVLAASVAWVIMPDDSCTTETMTSESLCVEGSNEGWRWLLYALSGLTFFMWAWRFFVFHGFESPAFLLSKGRTAEAAGVVRGLADQNSRLTWLTVGILTEVGDAHEVIPETTPGRWLSKIKPLAQLLGGSKKLRQNTILLWTAWALIGLAFPLYNSFLPQYLASAKSSDSTHLEQTYEDYAIICFVGLPGAVAAAGLLKVPRLRRKVTMGIAAAITGALTFVLTASPDSKYHLGVASVQAFFQNIMYGTLYAYTPEAFGPANRASGVGIGSSINRLFGIAAPIIAIFASESNPRISMYVSGGLFIVSCGVMLALPFDAKVSRPIEAGQRSEQSEVESQVEVEVVSAVEVK